MREALTIDRLKRVYAGLARRYDIQHAVITAGSDGRGRRILVEAAVAEGDRILDCGSGTGATGIMALEKAGPAGELVVFDLSVEMMAVAREKVARAGLEGRVSFCAGDLTRLPFGDESFDVVLSTYSLCPVQDPARGTREFYRVVRRGGRIGVAHSTEPRNAVVRRLADAVEYVAWWIPSLSMGCRAVRVLPELARAGGSVVLRRDIGVPLWPFTVFVVEKPAGR